MGERDTNGPRAETPPHPAEDMTGPPLTLDDMPPASDKPGGEVASDARSSSSSTGAASGGSPAESAADTDLAAIAEPDSGPPCAAGLFGKLPARGDFVARGIDRALLRPLEDWLMPVVEGARGVLGEGWASAWRAAPAWRFWIGPGALAGDWTHGLRSHGGGAITGVLLPSADRQGRLFPLAVVLADEHARRMPPPVIAPPDRTWYAACDRLLHAARGGDELVRVEAELAGLRAPARPAEPEGMEALLAQRSLWAQGTTADTGDDSDVWEAIRTSDHHLAALGRSYWWAESGAVAAGPTGVITLAGLPDADTFAFMLTQAVPSLQESDMS